MAAPTPEQDVAAALATALGLAVGTDIKYGVKRSPLEPGNDTVSIWVAPTGGPPPDDFLNAAVEGSIFHASLQCLVLSPASDPDNFASGLALARQVRDALHTKTVGGYIMCRVQQSEPFPLGADEAGRWEFSVNIQIDFKWRG